MFGLPPGDKLREAVMVLARDHERTVGENTGTEPPLLRLLERAIRADTSGAGGGPGRNKNSTPLDVTALSLWEEIAEVVSSHWPGRGDPRYRDQHLIDRLTWWTNNVAGTENHRYLEEFALWWIACIRNLLEPPKRIAIRGVTCPSCDSTWVVREQPGETIYVPALLAHASENPLRVECLACGENFNELALRVLVPTD